MTAAGKAQRPAASAPAFAHEDAGMRAEVLRGLRGTPKTLPPKLFYGGYFCGE